MRKLSLLPCVTLLIAAAPAHSAEPQIAKQAAPSETQQPMNLSGGKSVEATQDKKICKNLPSSYSRLPNKACLTEKEWKQVEEEASH